VAVKPTSSIKQKQHSVNINTGQQTDLVVEGRHDTCIALRVPVIVEAAAAIVLADLMLLAQQTPRINL
jgi:chorismate synthase